MIRLFVGLALPDAQRKILQDLSCGIDGARWLAPENLHITLRFIGEVDEDLAEDLALALAGVKAAPFSVTLQDLGTFGHPPHALWAGVVDQPAGALAGLAAQVESTVVRAGLEPEHRKFTPHVTLARLRKGANVARLATFMESHGGLSLEPFDVTGFSVFQSHLRQSGAEYERIVDYDFA